MDNKITDITAVHELDLLFYDDIKSLQRHIKTGSFEYVDIASVKAWKEALQEWPLLAEWEAWSQQ